MFRKRNGSIGFSFTSFVQNAVPSMGMSPAAPKYWCADLGQDMLYMHQMAAKHPGAPFALDERSLFVGGICEAEGTAAKVFNKLRKAGVLDDEGCVHTNMIDGKQFLHQVPILSQPRSRDLINLLFWWEEECQRLRKLLDEEKMLGKEIKRLEKIIATTEADNTGSDDEQDDQQQRQLLDNLKFEREKIRMRIRQRPSQRRHDVEAGTDRLLAEAQAANSNGRRRNTEPALISSGSGQVEEPPGYHP